MRPKRLPIVLKLSRRDVLKFLLALWTLVPASQLFSAGVARRKTDLRSNLSAFLDILLPEDESPSASQVGVAAPILAEASANPDIGSLLETGSTWLDMQARQHGANAFNQLDEERQIGIVELAETQPQPSTVRVYFRYVQDRAFKYYYAHPQSWPSLGYEGPPQPRGFPDYDQPPRGALQ